VSTATRGTILAGRYRLEERLQSNADGALWRAVDATLDRRVSIRVMRPAHPFSADVADAARRAALIDDPRLVRVLDVGSDGDTGFVVSEDVDGDSLATLVERSPLAAQVVRRIVGEVAQGLDAAAARGLHHLCLTPRSVIVTRDGSVKIVGTAVEAAASGMEPAHAATASRDDAIALVSLLYSGLTGRWPLGNAGFPPAPRGVGGGPVPPADLVRGIPTDRDTLCVVTLSGPDDGPRTPAELVKELAPWPSAEEAPLRAAPRRQPSDAPPPPLTADSPLKIRSRPIAKRGAGAKPARSSTPPTAATAGPTAPPVAPAAAAASTSTPAAASAGPPATAASSDRTDSGSGGKPPRRSAAMFPTSVALTGSLPIPKEPAASGQRRMDSLFTPTIEPGPPGGAPAAPSQPARTSPAAAATPAAPARESDQSAEKPPLAARSSFSAAGTKTPSSKIKATPEAKPTGRGKPTEKIRSTPTESGGGSSSEPFLPWGPQTWSNEPTPGTGPDQTGPFPILIPAEAPPREQSRLVIFSITVVLVLGLLVAAFSLRDIGSSGDPSVQGTPTPTIGSLTPTETAAATETAEPTPSAEETTPEPSATESVPVQIASIRAIDPQGDGDEDTASSPLAVDGDESTFWNSQTYRSSAFGGLKKGVGLSLKLKQSAALTSATIDVRGVGGAVEVRTGNSPDVSSSKLVGRGTIKNGRVTVEAKSAKPAKYVILWFTKLPSVGGNYKVEVSEVRLK
jgi:hypothetical protein